MAAPRVEIPEVVLSGGQAVSGASVQVNNRGAGSATVFAAEVGGTTAANPIITDANGRIEGWLEEGSYDLVVSATGLTTYTQPYEAVRGNNSPGKIATVTGDIVYASSANNIARLGIGSTGQALVVASGVPSWGSVAATTYRKNTAKVVNTTVSAVDLLSGEITVAAGAMGTTGALRLTAWGDWLQNSGGAIGLPRFQLILGPTTLLDSGALGATSANSGATRKGWFLEASILNLGSAASQATNLKLTIFYDVNNGTGGTFVTGVGSMQSFNGATTTTSTILGAGTNQTTVDTSSAQVLALKVINASASATYETKLFGAVVEVV